MKTTRRRMPAILATGLLLATVALVVPLAAAQEEDPCGGWVSVSQPWISGDAVVGGTLTANEGHWGREYCPTLPGPRPTPGDYAYQWLADDEPIAGATAKTFVVTENEAGKLVSVRVYNLGDGGAHPADAAPVGIPPLIDEEPAEEDSAEAPAFSDVDAVEAEEPPPVESDDPGPPEEGGTFLATTPSVTWSGNRDMFVFRNADGYWTIFKRCFDARSASTRRNAGPGYIVRYRRGSTLFVDDYQLRSDTTPGYINAVHGGLGTFGWHNARGPIGNTPGGDDPTTSVVEQRVDRDYPGYGIEGRMCAPSNNGYGVYARSWSGPARINAGRVDLTFDVYIRDAVGNTNVNPNGDAIVRVRYRYSFLKSAVKVWIGITTYARNDTGGVQFVKEPKLTALLRGGGFKRMSVFVGPKGTAFNKGVVEGHPEGTRVLSTEQAPIDGRSRVRWDHGTSQTQAGATPCAAGPCFSVVMRAYPTTADGNILRTCTSCSPARVPSVWENDGSVGFDRWAFLAAQRSKTWIRDTKGGGNADESVVSWCGVARLARHDLNGDGEINDFERSKASEESTPFIDGVRTWELGGWKANAGAPYTAAITMFHAWTGGRGQSDCEPLERTWFTARQSFGAFAIYSLNSGWEAMK